MSGARRIGVDGYNLVLERGTGVATYGHNLQGALRGLGHSVDGVYGLSIPPMQNTMLQEIYFIDMIQRGPSVLKRLKTGLVGATGDPINLTGRVILDPNTVRRFPAFNKIWNVPDLFNTSRFHFRLTRQRLQVELDDQLDIMHWTYPLPIKLKGAANLYTLHDLVPLRLPYTTLDNKRYYYRLTKMLADKADHIVTVSETSRRDIIDILGIDENRVTNTYQAAEIPAALLNKSTEDVAQEILGLFGLKYKNYFLFFGAIEPKKNVGRMIQAYLSESRRVSAPLVLVGSKAWKSDQELRLLDSLAATPIGVSSPVRHIEYAPFSLLVSLIRGARAVIFPSLYEGFGLPIVEAMQLGVPVITSNSGSMKEVAGEAARFINPYDIDSIARAIRDVNESAELRRELVEAGRKRAEMFSLSAYQKRLTDLYARL